MKFDIFDEGFILWVIKGKALNSLELLEILTEAILYCFKGIHVLNIGFYNLHKNTNYHELTC